MKRWRRVASGMLAGLGLVAGCGRDEGAGGQDLVAVPDARGEDLGAGPEDAAGPGEDLVAGTGGDGSAPDDSGADESGADDAGLEADADAETAENGVSDTDPAGSDVEFEGCKGFGDDDRDTVCNPADRCLGEDDRLDADSDGLPDGCDPCPGNAVLSTFNWVRWTPPIAGNSVVGLVGDVGVTYTSSHPIQATTSVYQHNVFPPEFNIPNVDPTLKNVEATHNTLTFARPVADPLLVFASVGSSRQNVEVRFDRPIVLTFQAGLSGSGTTSFNGLEGYAVVRVPGVHRSISFDYMSQEFYAKFVFGFGGTTSDTDGDGVPDACDVCPRDNPDDTDGDGTCDSEGTR